MRKMFCAVLFMMLAVSCACAEPVSLSAPEKEGGMPLMNAIAARSSSREFADADLTPQQLSNLLWAACGMNRPDGMVYPAALHIYDISVYALTRSGVYKYDAAKNELIPVAEGDHRAEAGMQPFVGSAAVNLAYVQDTSLWDGKDIPADMVEKLGYNHTGAVMQNVYLYAASQGWSAVVRISFDTEAMSKLLGLSEKQRITLVHTIGPRS